MPFYDFKCKCGYNWNDHRVTSSETPVNCPKCNELMERQFPLQVTIQLDGLTPVYMPPPKHMVDNPREYYS